MNPPKADTVLVRHAELGSKSSQVQHRMERLLGGNLQRMLSDRGVPGTVTSEHGRIFIHTATAQTEAAARVATDTMGVQSASPARTVAPEMDAMTDALADLAAAAHHDGSFAVRARRAGTKDAHPFTSQEIEQEGGAAIWGVLDERLNPEVDLEDPDRTYFVECRADEAFVFLEKHAGPGGLPHGTQGRVVALISGGIDSPVAAWDMLRRGCEIIPVYFDFGAYGGQDHVARAIEGMRRLARYVPDGEIVGYRIPIGETVEELMEEVHDTRMLSLRRYMFAVAEAIVDDTGAHGFVTGEAIGQKSSQTGQNLAVTSTDLQYPVYRPLLTADKQDIIARAKEIGTYQEATIDAGCNRIAPSHPETAATLDEVTNAEPSTLFDDVENVIDQGEELAIERPRDERPAPTTKDQA